jgi:tetratricopeptide (TPR) repeat protein
MKYLTGLCLAGFLVCTVLVGSSAAQLGERDQAREDPVRQQLKKVAPKMVDKFNAATKAMDQKEWEKAVGLYQEILIKAPDFEPALRRLGYCLVALGRREEGLQMSQRAVDLNRSSDNLMGHAANLAGLNGTGYQPTNAEASQALALAKEGLQKNTETNDPDYVLAVAQLSLISDNLAEFDHAVQILNSRFPNLAPTHYFNGLRLANNGEFTAAELELKRAEELGAPHEEIQPVLAAIAKTRNEPAGASVPLTSGLGEFSFLGKYFYYGAIVVLAWGLGLLALFVSGKVLSAKTLRSIETADPNEITGSRHASLRRVYRWLISFAGIYYFISQPVVALLVIVLTLGVIVFFFVVGWLPIKLLLIVGFIGLATVFYMIKTLFVRVKDADPGRALSEDEASGLWATVREVAQTLNTRPVNEIRITLGTDLAVYERGSMRRKLRDQAERVLILGVAVLNDFDQNAFRAVLAHEYGHFSNRDTAGGDIANRVNVHIFRLAQAMAEGGTATAYNIAFQFLRLYHFLFRRITHGATRLQEVLADRVAVYQYGAAAFRDGLTHVIRREIQFNHLADKEIQASRTDRRALQNLYEMQVDSDAVKGQLEEQVAAAITRPTTEDDTHPSPHDRFMLAARITSRPYFPVRGQVWDLFKDRGALTAEMNKLIEQKVGKNW